MILSGTEIKCKICSPQNKFENCQHIQCVSVHLVNVKKFTRSAEHLKVIWACVIVSRA